MTTTAERYEDKQDEAEEEEYPLSTPRRRPRARLGLYALATTVVLFAVLSIVYVAAAVKKLSSPANAPRVGDKLSNPVVQASTTQVASNDASVTTPVHFECGETVESAMSLGCFFDIMSNLWVPPHCHNATYALETLQGVQVGSHGGGVGAPEFGLQEYKWFEDAELRRPIATAQDLEHYLARRDLGGLPLEAYTQMSFHAAHCSYLARVATNGLNRLKNGEGEVWVPEVASNVEHARHCEHVFGELFRLGKVEAQRTWTKVGFGISPCKRVG